MQLATAALGWTGTAGHLTLSGPLIEARWANDSPFLIPWLLQVVLARPPNRFSFIQGSSADVIQLPVMTAGLAVFFKVHQEALGPLTFYC